MPVRQFAGNAEFDSDRGIAISGKSETRYPKFETNPKFEFSKLSDSQEDGMQSIPYKRKFITPGRV